MAKKKNKNLAQPEGENKQEKIVEKLETNSVDENVSEIKHDETEQNAIDAAVKEYNEEIKEDNVEEKRIRVREKADMAIASKLNKKVIIISVAVIFALIISFIAVAVINKMNTNVYRNIYINDKNLSGMNVAEFTDFLKTEQNKFSKTKLDIMQDSEKILEIMPADISFEIDIAAMQDKVFGFGRKSNTLKNNIDILYALICKKDFDIIYKYDVAKLADIVKEIKESLDDKVINDSYVLDENQYKLIITKGKSGNTIEEEYLKNKIISSLANGMGEYTLEVIEGAPEELDIDVVYSQVKRNAENAYIDKSLPVYKFVPHKVGLDFDKEDLANVLSSKDNKGEGKVIEYQLTVIEPEVKTSDINWEMYDYQISSFTTHFSTADPNRVNNLRVALNLLNGKVIMPGEVFSYNAVVGGATAAQGFKAAATFVGGRVVNEVGGGICQTVSTLYNTALLANLEIVQRKAHSLPVGYVPASRDATVYYPSIDFKFKNTREYPIKIVTSFNSGGSLTISLYGTKQENEYVVSITSKTLSTIKFEDSFVNDASMDKGTQQVIQNGSNGYVSEAYITKKLNGKIISTTLLSRDTYKPVNRILKIGTKEVYVAPAPVPAPAPTPAPTVPDNNGANDTNQDASGEDNNPSMGESSENTGNTN